MCWRAGRIWPIERGGGYCAALRAASGNRSPRRARGGSVGGTHRLARLCGQPAVRFDAGLDANTGPVWRRSVSRCVSRGGIMGRSARSTFPRCRYCTERPGVAAGNAGGVEAGALDTVTGAQLASVRGRRAAAGCASVLTGPGGRLGEPGCDDPRVRKVTFQRSRPTAKHCCASRKFKKMYSGNGRRVPVIVLPEADILVATSAVAAWFYQCWPGCVSRCSG